VRLTLPFKVLGIVGAVLLAYAAGNYTLQRHFVLQEFRKLEQESAQRDLQRADEAVAREQEVVATMASDWGNWNEIHEYMVSHNPGIPERDLSVSAMDGLGVDYVALVDTERRIIWTRSLHPDTRAAAGSPPVESTVLVTWKESMRDGEKRSGMIGTPLGTMMVAVAPVLNGEGGGPLRGSLILGRYFTPKVVAELANRTKLELSFMPQSGHSAQPIAADSSLRETPSYLELRRTLFDIAGVPLLQQLVMVPRDLLARGKYTVQLAAVSILVAALVSLLVLVALLRKLVLRPLTRLSEHVQHIGSSDDLSQRLRLQSDDEIGQLGAGIDSMVGQLQDARTRLVERSYEAGAAEMVRGTLHNVGNALTPMSVHSANIAASLKSAPLADIELALQEIGNAGSDEARASELRRFAHLAVGEATTQLAQATHYAEELQRSVDSLQDLLRLQMSASRQEQVSDRASIASMLDESVRLCPPDRIQRIRIEVAPALRALQPERVPVMLLKQVFQNLIINAAEAQSAGESGVIRVDGSRIDDSRGAWLELTFADNGSGIAPDAVGRLFEKGFSTKSAKRNSGIGLHWCANAMASIGGTIKVESRGIGHGARFTLHVPVQNAKEQAA
jgi:two-component system, NtrC family, sensor kinase